MFHQTKSNFPHYGSHKELYNYFTTETDVKKEYNLDINSTEFILSVSHQKEDFIDRYQTRLIGIDLSDFTFFSMFEVLIQGFNVFISLYWQILPLNIWHFYVYRCTWQGKPFDQKVPFTTTLTDLGVCFTFNKEDPPLKVYKSGKTQIILDSLHLDFIFD